MTARRLCCAVYTRKSSDEGLDQAFNSLDAQREACAAYVLSQRHEGWVLLPDLYDDGGWSGGTIERPALQRLLAEIGAGRIDVVVVYKVDRLTRSLADFARIIDAFDRQSISFVSVTQQFSTTTSMGRLTLNMLLSFAQFEREVTGERIRDKIAASKRKGMWMGGLVPLGYQASGRTLTIDPDGAETVRTLYGLYLEHGCVRRLKHEADRRWLVSRVRITSRPGASGGRPFSRGHLYRILTNRLYIGEIVHKGEPHPGQHPAIIDRETWDRVQARLADNLRGKRQRTAAVQPSLLAGLVFDDRGERLTPSHAVKDGRRYRYYISRDLNEIGRDDAPGGLRVPAHDLEAAVVAAITGLLRDEHRLHGAIDLEGHSPVGVRRILTPAVAIAGRLESGSASDRIALLQAVLRRVVLGSETIRISLASDGLRRLLGCAKQAEDEEGASAAAEGATVMVSIAARLTRRGGASALVAAGPGIAPTARPDPTVIRLVVRGQGWFDQLRSGSACIASIATAEAISSAYVTRLCQLTFLAPDIVAAIIDGTQPVELSATRLLDALPLPIAWPDQRRLLGFV